MSVRCLSVHARYRCRHSGACCSGVFAIPAEARVVDLVGTLGLYPPSGAPSLFVSGPESAGPTFVAARPDGACVFFEAETGRLCTIHRRAGAGALPSSCRHFPRVFLHDARAIFLSLSHFCPSAAALLMDDGPLTIVEADPPLALDGSVEAFEAVNALPPLLRPALLMDLEAYDAWERSAIGTLAREDVTHEQALAMIATATEAVRLWKPGEVALAVNVRNSFAATGPAPIARADEDDARRLHLIEAAYSPGRLVPADVIPFDRPIKRFLAAKLFGNRFAYEGRGLRSMVEWLRICLALLRYEAARVRGAAGGVFDRDQFIEAIRATDLVLVHRLDTPSLARRLEPLEHQP